MSQFLPSYKAVETSLNIPKMSTEELQVKNGYYVTTDGVLFNYYQVKPQPYSEDDGSPFIRLLKHPPVIMEGWVILNKKIYRVTVEDLFRGLIRKSRQVALGNLYERSTSSTSDTSNPVPGVSDVEGGGSGSQVDVSTNPVRTSAEGVLLGDKDRQAIIGATSLEELEVINATSEEQIRALLDFMHSKEGEEGEAWEVAISKES